MELAFQYLAEPDRYDLVLHDTTTGARRTLVGDVAWQPPEWSADGRWVRFEQELPGGGFAWREVDAETGAVRDVSGDGDAPDTSRLPGYYDHAAGSPARQWTVYRHTNDILCVASADGAEAFALRLTFTYFAADAYWSPCGTKLAAHLSADPHTGAHVIDLRTGRHLRVSPEGRTEENGWADYHVNGWAPGGDWVVATRTRWHDPLTYDYEWQEIWLLAEDGTAAKRLTDDGRCRNAAIRPTGQAPPDNGEQELAFAWAERLRGPDDPPAAGEAIAALVRLDPEIGPPFDVLLTVRTDDGLTRLAIEGCQSIPEVFARLDTVLREHNYRPSDTFTVVLPRYATGDELTVLQIAHLILAETRTRLWQFDRDLPVA